MTITRAKLYEEIWAEPITKVSKRYEVSDSYLVRVLKSLNIPRPPRGYWAMVAAGIHPDKPPLPAAKLGDAITWSRDGNTEFETSHSAYIKNTHTRRVARSTSHGIVRDAREHFNKVRESRSLYLKPYKKLTIDLIVSKDLLEYALKVTSKLYLLLEDHGHQVRIAPESLRIYRAAVDERENTKQIRYQSDLWQPYRPTVVYMRDLVVGLTVFEISKVEEVGYIDGKYLPMTEYLKNPHIQQKSVFSWTTKMDAPSGRLCIQVYSTHPGTKWLKQWRESKPGEFSKTLATIVRDLCDSVDEVRHATQIAIQEAEESQRKWNIQRDKERIEAEKQRYEKNLTDSKDELYRIIESWAEAKRIDEFFKDALSRSNNLSDDDRRAIESRLTDARKLLGTIDALERFKGWKLPDER